MKNKTSKKLISLKNSNVQCSDVHRCWLRKWLMENYLMKDDTNLQSQLVYTHYTYNCSAQGLIYIDHASFFQVIKEVFPAVELKKMAGKRDKDGWEYAGLDIQPNSEEYTTVAKGRRIGHKLAAEERSLRRVSTLTEGQRCDESDVVHCHCPPKTPSRSQASRLHSEVSVQTTEERSQKFFLSIECIRKDLDLDEIIVSVRADSALDIRTSNSLQDNYATVTLKQNVTKTGNGKNDDVVDENMSADGFSEEHPSHNICGPNKIIHATRALKSNFNASDVPETSIPHEKSCTCDKYLKMVISGNNQEDNGIAVNTVAPTNMTDDPVHAETFAGSNSWCNSEGRSSGGTEPAPSRKIPKKRKKIKRALNLKNPQKKIKLSHIEKTQGESIICSMKCDTSMVQGVRDVAASMANTKDTKGHNGTYCTMTAGVSETGLFEAISDGDTTTLISESSTFNLIGEPSETLAGHQVHKSQNDKADHLQLPNLQLAMAADLASYFRVGSSKSSMEVKSDSQVQGESEADDQRNEECIANRKTEDGSKTRPQSEKSSDYVPSPDMKWQTLPKKFKEEHWDLVQQWLEGEYEESSSVCLPRVIMYNHYLDMCKTRGIVPATQGTFGRMIMHRFKQLTMRRLGSRGNSQYCYMGVDVREESSHFNHLSQHRVVCTLGKPKHSTFPQLSKFSTNTGKSELI